MNSSSTPRLRGRPRVFNEERFLDTAIALFSGAGFAGVSMSDITKQSGLTTGSIYKAYKDKEGVFAHALDRYISLREIEIAERLDDLTDARSRIAALLGLYADLSQGRDGRLGCMVVSGIADIDLVGDAAEILQRQLLARQERLEDLLREGHADGSVAATVDPAATAALLLALLQGMRILGKVEMMNLDRETVVSAALRLIA